MIWPPPRWIASACSVTSCRSKRTALMFSSQSTPCTQDMHSTNQAQQAILLLSALFLTSRYFQRLSSTQVFETEAIGEIAGGNFSDRMSFILPTPSMHWSNPVSNLFSLISVHYFSKDHSRLGACLGGSVGWGIVRTCRNGLPEGRGSIPGSAGRFRVRISGVHALRLISRAGKEGSTVSSIICDRWLILS